MAQRVAQASGNASAGATWVGGVAPVDGDTIRIPGPFVVVQDVNRTYGSKTAAVGHAVKVEATGSGSFGKLQVADGIQLTVRGFDRDYTGGGNTVLYTDTWAVFEPLPGSTIVYDVSADGASQFINHGILTSIGTAAKRITHKVPATNMDWNTAASQGSGSQNYEYYDKDRKVGAWMFQLPALSNAAGTALGTMADSSVTFSAVTPASILTTPVATIALVNGAGKYFVDHEGGTVFFYLDKAVSTVFEFTINCKRLAAKGVTINSTDDNDGNQAIARYSDFIGMGSVAFGEFAVHAGNKYTASGTLRGVEVTNCAFRFGRGIQIRGVHGTAGAPVKLEDNDFQAVLGDGYGYCIGLMQLNTDYVSVQRNKRPYADGAPFIRNYGGNNNTHANWVIADNVARGGIFFAGGSMADQHWPGLDMYGNATLGTGGSGDSRQWAGMNGVVGAPARMRENFVWRPMRAANFGGYCEIEDGVIGHSYHHTINPSSGDNDVVIAGLKIRRMLHLHGGDALSDLGYNTRSMLDQPEVTHNTTFDCLQAALSVNFPGSSSENMNVGLLQSSNLVHTAPWAVRRDPTASGTRLVKLHLRGMDYNNFYNLLTATFTGGDIVRLCTVTGIVNVSGVSLSNPTFAGAVSGKSLVYTKTSNTNQTLAFDGGAAVQLVDGSGAATGASNENTFGNADVLRGFLDDTSKAFSSDYSVGPIGYWVLITGGTGAGQVRRVMDVPTATKLAVAPAWTVVPNATSTYVLLKSEVLLTGAAGTVNAGVDARVLPATSQTDAAVALTFNTRTLDPQFVDSTRSFETWDASLGGPGTEDSAWARLVANPTLTRTSLLPYLREGFRPTNVALSAAAHDGTTIGAIQYASAGPGPADHMTVTTQPSTPTASGVAHTAQPQGDIVDSGGTVVNTDTTLVTAVLVVESGTATAIGDNTTNAVAGHWSFVGNGLGATNTGSGPAVIHWSIQRAGLPSINTASVTINAPSGGGGVVTFAFTRQPGGGVVGGMLNPQPRIERRVDGVAVPGDSTVVGFTLATPSGVVVPQGLSGTTSGPCVNGVFDPGDIGFGSGATPDTDYKIGVG